MARGTQIIDMSVAAGAVLTTSLLDLSGFDDLLIVVNNAAPATTRALTLQIYDPTGKTLLHTVTVRTVAAAATESIHIGPSAVATGITAAIAMPLPVKAKLNLAAGGADVARLTVIGR